jgi:hypothetical protein
MNFDDPSLPSRLIPIVGLRQCDVAAEIADYFSLLRAVRKSILDGQRALFRPAVTTPCPARINAGWALARLVRRAEAVSTRFFYMLERVA